MVALAKGEMRGWKHICSFASVLQQKHNNCVYQLLLPDVDVN